MGFETPRGLWFPVLVDFGERIDEPISVVKDTIEIAQPT